MKNEQLIGILKEIGLSENEAVIYLTSLSLGPATILKISKSSEIRRTTVYSVAERLRQRGLMHIKPSGIKQLHVAEHPEKLESIVEGKKNSLKKVLPQFAALYKLKEGEGTVHYYEGLPAIKNIYETALSPLRPGEDFLVISDLEKFFSKIDSDYFEGFLEKRIKSRVNARLIVTDSERARNMKKYAKNLNSEVRILPPGATLSVDVMVLPQKATIFNLDEPLSAVSLENEAMIQMHKQLFEIIWTSLPE